MGTPDISTRLGLKDIEPVEIAEIASTLGFKRVETTISDHESDINGDDGLSYHITEKGESRIRIPKEKSVSYAEDVRIALDEIALASDLSPYDVLIAQVSGTDIVDADDMKTLESIFWILDQLSGLSTKSDQIAYGSKGWCVVQGSLIDTTLQKVAQYAHLKELKAKLGVR